MKTFILTTFIYLLLIFVSSCAAPQDHKDCNNNFDCEHGYICNLSNKRCIINKLGNLNFACKSDKTCNDIHLKCSKDNICIVDNTEKQCHPNDRASCYTAQASTLGKGICKPGYYLCDENSKWNLECINEIVPTEEICNNGLDDDCDGQIDENCDKDNFCRPYDKKTCYSADISTVNLGICHSGKQTCLENNKWDSTCKDEITPIEEICNNALDDNCNGKIDEGCTCQNNQKQSCFSGNESQKGIGECKAGIQTCINHIWGECANEVLPEDEKCDNLDNNCNGIIDEGVTNLCNGSCQTKETELCDGIDNNCDGNIDENCSRNCLDFEVCGNFIDDNCNGKIDENCYDKPTCLPKEKELCDNYLDDDCSLFVNDNCSCKSGETSDCYSGPEETIGVGECKKGKMYCIGGEFWGNCNQEVVPIPELCNGLDDNCNGVIDENFHVAEKCFVGLGACKKEGVFVCDNLGGTICVDTQTGEKLSDDKSNSSKELCDGIDNDCDGYIDEDFLINQPCNSGYSLCEEKGVTICSEDKLSVICNAKPNTENSKTEICNNNIDDDCDGDIDEKTGDEICGDSIDNNCNGLIDERPCISSAPSVTCPTLDQVYKDGENKIYTLENYTFTASATDPNNDELSYKWELVSAPEGNGQYPSPNNQLTTHFTPYLVSNKMNEVSQPYVLKFTATEKNTNQHLSNSCNISFNAVTKDVFHIELIWDNIGDMDLHLVVPTGTENSFTPSDNSTEDCNFETCRGAVGLEWNGINNLDNPYLDLDNTVGFGSECSGDSQCNRPENINVPEPRVNINDIYRVGVYAFAGESYNLKVKILCKSQNEDEFMVKEYMKDVLKSTSSNSNRWWKPANIIWHGTYCTIEDN